jgi:hypothetical protein
MRVAILEAAMRGLRHAGVLSAMLCVIVLAASVGASAAGQPIKPGQHFVGLVNGSHRHVVVRAVCPGPVSSSSTGPVAGGQHMAVSHVAKGAGSTGVFSKVYAWFVPDVGAPAPTSISFNTYGTAKKIPTSIRVPCSGTGVVEFSSCPYLAPCAFGWVPYDVHVRFENIAA